MSPEAIFHNRPKLSEHAADEAFNERRVFLAAQLETFISSHHRFQGVEVSVTFAHRGVSSLVAIIETPSEKLVLKIPLSTDYAEGEAVFLKAWERAGVQVPQVFEEGVLEGYPYILMEYIDAPVLADAYSPEELATNDVFTEMGRTLRLMHTPEAEGYGRVIEGKAEFKNFRDWLYSSDIDTRIAYAKEQGLLSDEHGSISAAFETLETHVAQQPHSSYCHDDFGASNIFATNPITVFDPNPRFQNNYLDLGRSALIHLSQGIPPEPLLKGYFGDAPYEEDVLRAAVLLNTYMKFPYWHKTGKTAQIQRMQEYFSKSV